MAYKMTLLERLEKAKPGRHPVFTAVETLRGPTKMKQFYQEYVGYLRQHGDSESVRADPEAVANSNIGYIVGYYDKETADRWFEALPDVSHPIFGRDIFSVSPEDAFKAGQIASQEGQEGARRYIEQKRGK